jgi:type I restriction enzyme S subunit
MEELRELPKGWAWTGLINVVDDVEKVNPKNSPDKEIIYIDIASIDNKNQKIIEPKLYLGKDAPSRARQLIKAGDILFSTVRTYLKNIANVDQIFDRQIASTGFCVIRPSNLINKKLLFYLVQTDSFLNPLNQIQRGTSYPAVRDSDVFSQFIPVAPLREQHHIVAKIEELFTNLDAGVEYLEKIKAQLKRYRQAVLKHAFEGKLTEEWRTNNPPVEPASELLERILVERRKKWEEEQLLRFKEKGQNLQKNWKDKYTEPAKPDTTNLPLQPKGWRWSTTDTMFYFVTSGSRGWSQYYSDEGSTFIRVGNLDHSSISLDLSNIQRVLVPNNAETIRTRVKLGDILISITADVGMVALISEELGEAYINQHIALTRSVNLIHLPYLSWFLASEHGAQKQFKELQRGATKAGLGLDDIKNVFIPVPPFKEQVKIVEIIEERFSIVTNADLIVNNSEYRASRLRQAILKRAFEGKLVPQDPNDEPAEKLLDRIRLEKIKKTANIRSLS